jgi:hypothetical protein
LRAAAAGSMVAENRAPRPPALGWFASNAGGRPDSLTDTIPSRDRCGNPQRVRLKRRGRTSPPARPNLYCR